MPRQSDAEIKALLDLMASGQFVVTNDTGYWSASQQVPLLYKKVHDADPTYKNSFKACWSRIKKKHLAEAFMQPVSIEATTFPPSYKPPKRAIPVKQPPVPAPSPTQDTSERAHNIMWDLEGLDKALDTDDFIEEFEKHPPKKSSLKKSPQNPVPKSPPKQTTMNFFSTDTLQTVVNSWIQSHAAIQQEHTLDVSHQQGLQWIKVPFSDGVSVYITYIMMARGSATIMPGGKKITFEYQPHANLFDIVSTIKDQFQEELTNPERREKFLCFEKSIEELRRSSKFGRTTKCTIPVEEFQCREEFATDTWDNDSVFDNAGVPVTVFTIKDAKNRATAVSTTKDLTTTGGYGSPARSNASSMHGSPSHGYRSPFRSQQTSHDHHSPAMALQQHQQQQMQAQQAQAQQMQQMQMQQQMQGQQQPFDPNMQQMMMQMLAAMSLGNQGAAAAASAPATAVVTSPTNANAGISGADSFHSTNDGDNNSKRPRK